MHEPELEEISQPTSSSQEKQDTPSPKKLSRRSLIKRALGFTVGAAISADAGYSLRVGQSTHEITSQTATELDKRAAELALHIKVNQEDLSLFKVGEKVYQPFIDPQIIAKSLLYLSFLDGGEKEVHNVINFVSQRTIEVNGEKVSTAIAIAILGANAAVSPSKGESDPIGLILPRLLMHDYFEHLPQPDNDYIIFHELYHIVQQARDPQAMEAMSTGRLATYMTLPVIGGVAIGIEKYKQYIQRNKVSRRNFLRIGGCIAAGAVCTPLSAVVTKGIGGWIEPLEAQAYIQAGGMVDPGQLTKNDIFNNVRGKLISFNAVS